MGLSIDASDIIATIGIGVPVLLTYWQLRKANIQSRAQFIINLFAQHTSDSDTLELLYRIEHKEWKFNEQSFPLSADERALDKLLYCFEQFSSLYELGTITRHDMRLIEYDFLRVYMDSEVKKYFAFLERTPHGLPTDRADFNTYRRVAKRFVSEFKGEYVNPSSTES